MKGWSRKWRVAVCLVLGLLALLTAMLIRTLTLAAPGPAPYEAPELSIDQRRVCERLSRAIQIPSISSREPDSLHLGRMNQMVDFVIKTFTPLQTLLEVERYPQALVFRWKGQQPELEPLLLLAHLDVVPVEPGSESTWTHPPFSGEITAGYIWGRGTLDDKSSAFAILEAIEHLAVRGHRPERGVIVAIGLDEEIGGEKGAGQLAKLFEQEGLRPHLILDEGFAVLDGVIDVVPGPVAGVGVAEKGLLTLELLVSTDGGHASMPEKQTSLGILSAAIAKLESHPMPARLDGAAGDFFDELARQMDFAMKFLFANRWITEPVLRRVLDAKGSTAALLRTTTAVTTARAGVASNVLPEEARATVNFRIHPRDSVQAVIDHTVEVIDDERVVVKVLGSSWEPSSTSPSDGPAWDLLERTIRECYPDVQVVPALVLAATDSRHYGHLSPNVYRFNGIRLGPKDLERIHGNDERISAANYLEMIRFYARLIEES